MRKNLLFYILAFLLIYSGSALADTIPTTIEKRTIEFAQKDTSHLKMDIYRLKGTENLKQPAMIFIFGGAFKAGKRDEVVYNYYLSTLPANGITTISIDYRLGLVNRKISLFNTTAADDAINMAVEDLYSATQYILENADDLGIDPDCILISGSSAGAITVLQADYYLANRMPLSEMLPIDFRYKGVISFAGGIFSHKGTPDYKSLAPAPTLFFHGDKDKVVSYNKLRLFRRGMFGSKPLSKRFQKRGFNYLFLTMKDKGHSVAVSPMNDHVDIMLWFIQHYIYEGKNWQMCGTLKDLNAPAEKGGSVWGVVD